ncbi:hypothetical protein WA158_006344 [Blastocystis sp. Blastoise]
MFLNFLAPKPVNQYPLFAANYAVFFGDDEKLCSSISVERLTNCWKDSLFYKNWLERVDTNNNKVYVGKNDRNLNLIFDHMNGRTICIEGKSKQELEELKEDFESFSVTVPEKLLKTLNAFSVENDDSKSDVDGTKIMKNESMDMNEIMATLLKNSSQMLNKVNTIENEIRELREDQNELKKVIKDHDDSIHLLKNGLRLVENGKDFETNYISLTKQDMNQYNNIQNGINQIAEDNGILKYGVSQIKEYVEMLLSRNILYNGNNNNKYNDNIKDASNNRDKEEILNQIESNSTSESSVSNENSYISSSKHYFVSRNTNFIDSIILNGNNNYINALNFWFGKEKIWKLVFRASEHEYKASEFHKYCDHKCPTVTIIKHIGHDNKINIFGGYTTQYWESRTDDYNKYDCGSFIFTLNNEYNILPTKYDILDPNNALHCDINNGPDFNDICISDDCHNNSNSYINGKTVTYTHSIIPQFRSLFVNTAGPKQKNSFIVDDYEVYELIPDYDLYLPLSILITKEMGIQLSKWFNVNKEWKLLYRCSDENRSVKKWHEKCDDKESLVIIEGKGKNSQSYIFGGYTSVGWGKNHSDMENSLRKGTGYRIDSKAFLFSLTNPHGHNYTKLNINPKFQNNALISNNPKFELAFCSSMFLTTDIDKDQFVNGNMEFLDSQNPVYFSPYSELGNSFFVNTNTTDRMNEFDLIDFEIFTSN